MHYAIWVCMHKSLCTKSVTASGHALRGFMHYNRMHYENFDCISAKYRDPVIKVLA